MKKKTLNRFLTVVLTMAMSASLLSGCGGGDDGSADSSNGANIENTTEEEGSSIAAAVEEDPSSISGTIEVGGWPSGDDGFEAAMAGFSEAYPYIEVELVFTDTTAHHQALQTALTDLNVLGASELKDDFVAFKWDQATSSDGQRLIGIPWDLGPTLYYYRTDVFEEVGLPTAPDEVAELMSLHCPFLHIVCYFRFISYGGRIGSEFLPVGWTGTDAFSRTWKLYQFI